MVVGPPSGNSRALRAHHQYSSSVSPFQAKTGSPARAIAAAAWSWVLKILQLAQRTSAPRSRSVSISTAVWIVHVQRAHNAAPVQGFLPAILLANRHQAGHLLLGQVDFLPAENRQA